MRAYPSQRAAPGPRAWLDQVLARFGSMVYNALPMTLEEREERDWSGETSAEEAERRQLQVRLLILERGGGGYLS
jgi:hypothetical protein